MIKLYAKYLKNKVRVTFNVGPNAQPIEPKEYDPGSQLGTITVDVDENYEFKGWYTTQTFDEGTLVNETYQIDNDITLYAKIELKQYTVTFNVGPNAQPIEPKIYDIFSELGEIKVITNDGYKFIGWYTTETFDEFTSVDEYSIIENNMILYAKIIDKNLIEEPKHCDYFFSNEQDFKDRIGQICAEHNNDLSEVTLGFDNSVTELRGTSASGLFPSSLIKAPKMIFARNVTSFSNCFYNCSQLTEIPVTLFDKCTQAYNFSDCFNGCSSLTTIPAGLFDKCTETSIIRDCFSDCSSLTTIPAGLFDKCTQINSFSNCFKNCSSLVAIPTGLFDNNTAAKTFTLCFYGCSSLKEIPERLFDNISVEDFASCFEKCTSLTTIPEGLFNNGIKISGFNRCFYECTSLTTIPKKLFDNCFRVKDFSHCFYGCSSVTSAIPDAWNRDKFPEVVSYSMYAYNCTDASNYDEIPTDWK